MTSRDMIKLGVAACLLAVAVVAYVTLSSKAGPPDADEARSAWFCPDCDAGFELTVEQVAAMVSRVRREPAADEQDPTPVARPQRRGHTTVEVAKCLTCGKMSGVAARRCRGCRSIFPARNERHEPAVCPKCGWNPTTGRTMGE